MYQCAQKSYSLKLEDTAFTKEDLHEYKGNIESVIFEDVDYNVIREKINKNILPIIQTRHPRIDPIGFFQAEQRVGKGLILKEVPLMPRTAKTFKDGSKYIDGIINELFSTEFWINIINKIIADFISLINESIDELYGNIVKSCKDLKNTLSNWIINNDDTLHRFRLWWLEHRIIYDALLSGGSRELCKAKFLGTPRKSELPIPIFGGPGKEKPEWQEIVIKAFEKSKATNY